MVSNSANSHYLRAEDEASIRTLHRAVDLGITCFDTATGYGAGHNEILLGQALRDLRDDLVIASKFVHYPDPTDTPTVSARSAVEASLQRIGLDHIDICLTSPKSGSGQWLTILNAA